FAVLIELYFMIFISYNRGALLALILLFTLFFIRKIKRTPYRLFSFGVMTLLGVYLFANLQTVLIYVYNFLAENNISVNFLSKSISSLTLEDFSSGRTSLYESAMILFNKAPIFGNGIGHFASLHNGQYPHNLFLESLTDQGVLITAVLFIFCLICVYKFLTTEQNNLLILAVLLFSLSLPRLMISSTVWMSPFFWALVVIILINPSFRNTKTI
ncbi:O-antigen ligase family protein, partial [Nosocomiicoccus massiliensis]|uniref:O-antigen ligase family protein n=1 Tax=Nosocomiicoccus massiliensis TaxID=1232430 RepID=UPI0005930D76